jgi:hypothetical protein
LNPTGRVGPTNEIEPHAARRNLAIVQLLVGVRSVSPLLNGLSTASEDRPPFYSSAASPYERRAGPPRYRSLANTAAVERTLRWEVALTIPRRADCNDRPPRSGLQWRN